MTFPKANNQTMGEGAFVLPKSLTVSADAELESAAAHLCELLTLFYGVDAQRAERDGALRLCVAPMAEDAYRLTVEQEGVEITASGLRGAEYAAATLIQLMERHGEGWSVPVQRIEDSPAMPIRGIHVYMPAREDLDEFLRIVDALAFLKLNTVILEVGGGMEYKRHPEINESWVKFCKTLDDGFPYWGKYRKSRSLQKSDIYWKDSCHTELAGGSYLTQEEVKQILAHCRKRGMEVIPEIQSFSHAYYLTMAHREIAERQDDAFPDTYCPLNEKSYELYFDVAEEVIEVFQPKMVSVGHDELRVLGFCEKCREKTGHELVAYELNRLHAFYAERGIRIVMWGDTAQKFTNYMGGEAGGLEVDKPSPYGHPYHLPATYDCLKDLPSDILMLDWFHSMGATSEDRYAEYGHDIIYGNFYGSLFGEWDIRSKKKGVRGAEVSTWCPANEEFFARDGIFFELAYSAYLLWSEGCDNQSYPTICDGVLDCMSYLRTIVRNQSPVGMWEKKPQVWYAGEKRDGATRLTLSGAKILHEGVKQALSVFGDELWGTPVSTGGILIRPNSRAKRLLFVHHATQEMPYAASHYFKEETDWSLGSYAVVYEDGDFEVVNLYYGRAMGCPSFGLKRVRRTPGEQGVELDDAMRVGEKGIVGVPCYYNQVSQWVGTLCYHTVPVWDGEGAAFVYEWQNPHPEKTVAMIKPLHLNHTPGQTVVLFGVAAINE